MSIATTIRQRYEAKEQDQQRKAGDRYRQMVRAAAAGKEPSLEQVEQAAAAVGNTVQDFANDVERQEKRIATAARVKLIPQQRTKLAELWQEIEAHQATLEEAIDRHHRACEPLLAMANGLTEAIDQAGPLKQQLIETADESVVAELQRASDRFQSADEELRAAQAAVALPDAQAAEAALPALRQARADAEAKYFAAREKLLEP